MLGYIVGSVELDCLLFECWITWCTVWLHGGSVALHGGMLGYMVGIVELYCG